MEEKEPSRCAGREREFCGLAQLWSPRGLEGFRAEASPQVKGREVTSSRPWLGRTVHVVRPTSQERGRGRFRWLLPAKEAPRWGRPLKAHSARPFGMP